MLRSRGSSLLLTAGLFLSSFASAAEVQPISAERSRQAAGREKPAVPSSPATTLVFVQWLESVLPTFMEVFSDRLASQMEVRGEKSHSFVYTDRDLAQQVIPKVQAQFQREIKELTIAIQADGIVGTVLVDLGGQRLRLSTRMEIGVDGEEIQLKIHEVELGSQQVPAPLVKNLEEQVNAALERQRRPIKLKQFLLYDGWALVDVERA